MYFKDIKQPKIIDIDRYLRSKYVILPFYKYNKSSKKLFETIGFEKVAENEKEYSYKLKI